MLSPKVGNLTAAPSETSRLPARIRVDFGPRVLLGRFFLDADRDANDRGVTLYLTHDLHRLQAVNARNRDSWAPLLPALDPDRNDIPPGTSFFIEGRDAAGEIVATQAARLYDWRATTLKDELESLRFLYRDPRSMARPGESITVTAPSASRIGGVVALSGGVWFRPDHRRRGLAKVLPRISRAYAHTLWGTDWSFGLVEPNAVERNLVTAYGYRQSEPWVRIRNGYRDLDWHLMSFSATDMLAELSEHMAARRDRLQGAAAQEASMMIAGRFNRTTEVPDTKVSPPSVVQGSSSRS